MKKDATVLTFNKNILMWASNFNKNKITGSFVSLLYLKAKKYKHNILLEIHLASSGKSRVSVCDTLLYGYVILFLDQYSALTRWY